MASDEDSEIKNQRALDKDDERQQGAISDTGHLKAPLSSKEVAFGFTSEELVDVTLSEEPQTQMVRISQLAVMLGFHDIALEPFDKCELEAAMVSVRGLGPKDEIERMHAYQIVAMNKSMGLLMHDVSASSKDPKKRESFLNMALKLHSAITKGTEVIDKHRNKGKQKITVKRIQVEDGGNAVVGEVDTRKYVQNNHGVQAGDIVEAEPGKVRSRKLSKQHSS